MRQRIGDSMSLVILGRVNLFRRRALITAALSAALATPPAVQSGQPASQVSDGDWSSLGRTPEQHHFSPLKAINDGNVKRLGLAWHAELPTADGLLANPLVDDG